MNPSIFLSASGALRQEKRLQLISQNLSNAQTTGYKKDVPLFYTLFSQAMGQVQEERGFSSISLQQGHLEKTGNPLDLALEGEGFFKVMTPLGVRYTRAGHFILDREQRLSHPEGYPVLGKNGEVRLSGKEIVVEKDGSIRMDGSESHRIAVVTFASPDRLKKEGRNLFVAETPEEEREAREVSVLQGYLEQSNVNAIEEMIGLIDSLRTYEACMKMIQSRDELHGKVVNDLGRV